MDKPHTNFEPYGTLEEDGIKVTAQICYSHPPHFVVGFVRGGHKLKELSLKPLMYGARAGVDISDDGMLNNEIERVLAELKSTE